MRLSQKTDYAVRAMLDLAFRAERGEPARVTDVARRAGVPEKFLEAILVDLRKAGLVESRRGPEGGHLLAREAGKITLGQIREALEGPLVLVARTTTRANGPSEGAIRSAWEEVERKVGAVLDGVTLEDIRRRAEEGRETPDFSI